MIGTHKTFAAQQRNWRLFKTLERIRKGLAIDHKQWAELLLFTPRQYERCYRPQNLNVSVNSLFHLSMVLGITVEALMDGDVDFRALFEHHKGHLAHIPEKYTNAPSAKIESVANLLLYAQLRENDNGAFRLRLMKRLQLTEHALLDHDRQINIRLMEELTTQCREYGFEDQDFINIGYNRSSFNLNRVHALFDATGGMPHSPSIIYERCIEDFPNLQENTYRYSISRLDSNRCIIQSVINEEVSDALHRKTYGNPEICLMRLGLTMVAPKYGGFPMARVKKTACIHHGDPACLF